VQDPLDTVFDAVVSELRACARGMEQSIDPPATTRLQEALSALRLRAVPEAFSNDVVHPVWPPRADISSALPTKDVHRNAA
jgi:hypothetical protein